MHLSTNYYCACGIPDGTKSKFKYNKPLEIMNKHCKLAKIPVKTLSGI